MPIFWHTVLQQRSQSLERRAVDNGVLSQTQRRAAAGLEHPERYFQWSRAL